VSKASSVVFLEDKGMDQDSLQAAEMLAGVLQQMGPPTSGSDEEELFGASSDIRGEGGDQRRFLQQGLANHLEAVS
jgi:hypothetical protein